MESGLFVSMSVTSESSHLLTTKPYLRGHKHQTSKPRWWLLKRSSSTPTLATGNPLSPTKTTTDAIKASVGCTGTTETTANPDLNTPLTRIGSDPSQWPYATPAAISTTNPVANRCLMILQLILSFAAGAATLTLNPPAEDLARGAATVRA
jgi:hypothetical protein